MSSPAVAPEATEQDQARDQSMPHFFCVPCYGEGPLDRARALCGTVARKRGERKGVPENHCLVCWDLWYCKPRPACSQCGQVPT